MNRVKMKFYIYILCNNCTCDIPAYLQAFDVILSVGIWGTVILGMYLLLLLHIWLVIYFWT